MSSPAAPHASSEDSPRAPMPWAMPIERDHRWWEFAAKRTLDLLIAIPAGLALAAIFPLIALAIRLDSHGPVIYRATRYGRGGRTFTVYKFRSMSRDAEHKLEDARHLSNTGGPSFKAKQDPRITRVGRWLRRSSLDELPQVFCVLRGDMSIVGPRPVQDIDFRGHEDLLAIRNRVKPGLTGLWQVEGRSNLPFVEMARLDLTYALQWSVAMDVGIILRTIPAVLTARGAM